MKKATRKNAKPASKATKKPSKTPLKPLQKIFKKISAGIRSKIRSIKHKTPKKPLSTAKPKVARRFSKTDLSSVRPVHAPAPLLKKEAADTDQSVRNGFELPNSYHEDKLMLLVRDPWWLYAFWEVTPERERAVLGEMNRRGLSRAETVLRVYDFTGSDPSKPVSFFDIELRFFTENWYVDVGKPDRDWFAEVGIRASDGSFFALVRSNLVRTPRFGISDVLDEEWMMPDEFYWKLFGYASGLGAPLSSLEARATVERYLRSVAGELSSFTGGPQAPKFESGRPSDH